MLFNEYVKIREEKCGTVIFETLREKVFVANETGKDILKLLERGYSIEKIVDALADTYHLHPSDIKEDIFNFINQLKKDKIVNS